MGLLLVVAALLAWLWGVQLSPVRPNARRYATTAAVLFLCGLEKMGARRYVPDLPDRLSCSETMKQVKRFIREAVQAHVKSLRKHGEPVPSLTVATDTLPVA